MVSKHAVNVLITVDTEVWCGGWKNIDAKFPEHFQRYIYGKTPSGDVGLPFQLKVLNDNGLRAVFFVEPLFATRFGLAPLEEIVGLITSAGQAVEMHLHTEWVDEARTPLLPGPQRKRQHIRQFSFDEQLTLLLKARELLACAGVDRLHAYRAGSFGANNDTLRALAAAGIGIDSSLNSTASNCAIEAPQVLRQPALLDGVLEVPVTVYRDGFGRQRPAQLTACSFAEMKATLSDAYGKRWPYFVILSHPFELLNGDRTRKNPVVVKRYQKLCEYLGENADRFPTINFSNDSIAPVAQPSDGLTCKVFPSLIRQAEQVRSRFQ